MKKTLIALREMGISLVIVVVIFGSGALHIFFSLIFPLYAYYAFNLPEWFFPLAVINFIFGVIGKVIIKSVEKSLYETKKLLNEQ